MEKSHKRRLRVLLLAFLSVTIFFLLVIIPEIHASPSTAEHTKVSIGNQLPIWSAIPFAGVLLSIAFLPLIAPHFWHKHYGKIAASWALLFAIPFLSIYRYDALYEIMHIYLIDYIPFIILLWGLFTIAGGIIISGSLRGTPVVNTILLAIGTILASWVGTTGAAMVMIRPVLRANKPRKQKVHVVCFFIFLVANIGGALTPLGDPPLFLGFLHNVPFFWVTRNILPHMLLSSLMLLIVFYALDRVYYNREKEHLEERFAMLEKNPIKVEGVYNLVFLAGVIILVLMSGYWKPGQINIFGVHVEMQNLFRDAGIILMGTFSLLFTPKILRAKNDFTWFPIVEVAKLFAGIFMTIIPALAILKAGSEGALGGLVGIVQEQWHYFWVTGVLSSFLDNAPTYLTFFNFALGKLAISEAGIPAALASGSSLLNSDLAMYLKAISAGAVFMGANTYIGNAPNFMVKSIAEETGVSMPSFFGYMIKYSIPILIPIFVFVTIIFF